jgi:hypothetical protein
MSFDPDSAFSGMPADALDGVGLAWRDYRPDIDIDHTE